MTVPAAPSLLTANPLTASRIDLAWIDASSDETGFSLERSTSEFSGFVEIATPAANATSYSDTGLAENTTYYYRILATNGDGDSAYSNTASALTLLVTQPLRPRLFLLQPEVVFAARVVLLDPADYPISFVAYDTVTTGAYTDISPGQTILLGSTPGGDDYGRQRIRKAATTISIFVGRSSRGTHDGELTLVDNAYITVWDDRRVWAKIPYIDSDGGIFKDSSLAVEDRTTTPPPVAVMGQGDARTVDADTLVSTVFFNGQNSYATSDGATITDYLWDIGDGTLTSGTLADDNITIEFPAGFRYVSLTVTDSNGKTHTSYRPVFADDVDHSLSFDGFDIAGRRVTDAGQTLTIAILEDMPTATYPDGTLAIIWDREPSGAANRDHIVIVGWLGTEENSMGAGKVGLLADTTLTIEDVGVRADTLPGFPQSLADDDTRDTATVTEITWNYMIAPTMDKYVHYLLHWHSTVLDVADFIWSGTGTDYAVAIKNSDGESLWSQVKRTAQAMIPGYELTCDQAGRVYMAPDPQLQDEADRTATVQAAIDEGDWSDIRFTYQRSPRVHWLRAGALLVQATITFNGDGTVYLPTVFSIAPGDTPGQGLGEVENNEGLAASQDVMNATTGHRYARANSKIQRIIVTLVQDDATAASVVPWRAIEPALKEWVTLTVSAATAARRGLTWTAIRCLPLEINMRYEHTKYGVYRTVELTLEPESSGEPGATVVKPDVPAVGEQPTPPVATVYVPDFGLISGQEQVVGIGSHGYVYRTSNFLSSPPTWDELLVTGDVPGIVYSFVVDPFSPGYRGVAGGSINGWVIDNAKIYRYADLFGSTTSTAVYTFAVGGVGHSLKRTVAASFGRYESVEADNPWIMAITYYTSSPADGFKIVYSRDAGNTWSAEITVTAHVATGGSAGLSFQAPTIWMSPRTPGKAIVIVPTSTGATPTMAAYVTTDWGDTWSALSDPLITSGNGFGGSIHVPWEGNEDESIVYYGNITVGATFAYRLKRSVSTVVTDISPVFSTKTYGAGLAGGLFGIRAYDLDRQFMVMGGVSDNGAGATNFNLNVAVSDDAGDTWTEIVAPYGSGNWYGWQGYQAAFAGDDPNIIYIMGSFSLEETTYLIAYTDDFGVTVVDKTGNIKVDFFDDHAEPNAFVGIAGGPTA